MTVEILAIDICCLLCTWGLLSCSQLAHAFFDRQDIKSVKLHIKNLSVKKNVCTSMKKYSKGLQTVDVVGNGTYLEGLEKSLRLDR